MRSNTPKANVKRKTACGRVKRILDIKKDRNKVQELVLPINTTKLRSPFLDEILQHRGGRGDKH